MQHKNYNHIFYKFIRIYRVLEKVKIQRYCKVFTKSVSYCIFLGCNCYWCTICVFWATLSFLTICWSYTWKQLPFMLFFIQVKTLIGFIDICVVIIPNYFEPSVSSYFYECSTYIVNNNTCVSC